MSQNITNSKGSLSLSGVPTDSGSEIVVSVKSEGFGALTSMQFTLSWDPTAFEMVSLGEYGLAGMDSSHFGTERIREGLLSFSWDPPLGLAVNLTPVTELFRLHLQPKMAHLVMSQIRFADAPTSMEVSENLEPVSPTTLTAFVTLENGSARFVDLPFVGLSRLQEDGSVDLEVWGKPGNRLRLERSSDLRTWSEIQSITVNTSDRIQIVAPGNTNAKATYLRVVETGL